MSYTDNRSEDVLILRLPAEQAQRLREDLAKPRELDPRQYSVDMTATAATGKVAVTIAGVELQGKLCTLPTLIESHKTLDNKFLFKTGDIHQIILCDEPSIEEVAKAKAKSDNKKKNAGGKSGGEEADDEAPKAYQMEEFPHGLTPPLRWVRKRRFRKTARKMIDDTPEVEQEVARLLKDDEDALYVTAELQDERDDVGNLNDFEIGSVTDGQDGAGPGEDDADGKSHMSDPTRPDESSGDEIQVSESSEEEPSQQQADTVEMHDVSEPVAISSGMESARVPDGDGAVPMEEVQEPLADPEKEARIAELREKLQTLKDKYELDRAKAENNPNPILQKRFLAALVDKKKEIDDVQALLDQELA